MTAKLTLYNEALGHLLERKVTLSEAREPRYVLDDYYPGVVAFALERGFWNHAMRSAQLDSSASIEPAFGYTYAFAKPADWVRTLILSDNEYLGPPGIGYVDEAGVWYADVDPIWGRFVSNDAAYGLDLSRWPQSFANYVSLALAVKGCKRITGSSDLLEGPQGLLQQEKKALAIALSSDAMNEPPGQLPRGSWASSRSGGMRGSRWNGRFS